MSPSAASTAAAATTKIAIVIGLGRGGIGDCLAQKFSTQGYRVAMIARSDLSHLENRLNNNSKSYRCDAGDPDQVRNTVAAICQDMNITAATSDAAADNNNNNNTNTNNKIDALLYNAGSGVFKQFADTTYEEFQASWKTGPAGLFLWTQACLPFMTAGSCIGITGATASWRGMPFTPAFASSKMATRGLAQALARDLGPTRGIHVFHVVIDGQVDLSSSGRSSSDEEKMPPPSDKLSPADIAETYWQLSQQPPNCWTFETAVAAQGAFGSILSI